MTDEPAFTADGDLESARAALVAGLDVPALVERAEQLLLGGPRLFTRAQVAEQAGMDADRATALWRALGFAQVGDDEVVFTQRDVDTLKTVRAIEQSGVADDELIATMTRILGQTFSRLASGQGQLLVSMLAQHPEHLESEESVLAVLGTLLPLIEQVHEFVWRRQFVAFFNRVATYATSDALASTLVPMAVGFADMSGFTALTRRATEAELGTLLEAFEATTTDVVSAHHGRIVKTIGDEVLFVADTPSRAAEIALDLLERSRADERLPALRIGLASGPVVSRLGDVYGSTVNIASRLTSLSRPGWVLVDRVVAESLAGDGRYQLTARRPESVRGFHHLRQWRLRRASASEPPARRRGRPRGRR